MNVIKSLKVRRDTKRVFFKKGTCSRTLFYILDREFGHPLEEEERATELLAGGILQQGYQCGMIWGAAFALGAESFRRWPEQGRAMGMAIQSTRHMLASFVSRAKSADCLDITNCDWSSKISMAKYLVTGKFLSCFKLADKWAPEAIQAATVGLSLDQADLPERPQSCAAEVVRKGGASDGEMVMASGLAGGLGLGGGGCGALAAAIWMNTLARIREKRYKTSFSDPVADRILKAFFLETDYELECAKITGKRFATMDDHTEFLKTGGCGKLISALADTISFR